MPSKKNPQDSRLVFRLHLARKWRTAGIRWSTLVHNFSTLPDSRADPGRGPELIPEPPARPPTLQVRSACLDMGRWPRRLHVIMRCFALERLSRFEDSGDCYLRLGDAETDWAEVLTTGAGNPHARDSLPDHEPRAHDTTASYCPTVNCAPHLERRAIGLLYTRCLQVIQLEMSGSRAQGTVEAIINHDVLKPRKSYFISSTNFQHALEVNRKRPSGTLFTCRSCARPTARQHQLRLARRSSKM